MTEDKPAFPAQEQSHLRHLGLGRRELFAAMALQGIMARIGWIGYQEESNHREFLLNSYVQDAVALADALIAELLAKKSTEEQP